MQERITQQAMQFSRHMRGAVQRILVEGTSPKNVMELSERTENNRVVNFEGAPFMIGKCIDVEIVDIYPNSLCGVLFRTEDMALRSHESPASVIAHTRNKERTEFTSREPPVPPSH